jgi:hypothetical protein
MVAIVAPAIEAVAVRVLTALGVGVVGGAVGEIARETAKKRSEEAEKARTSPIAKTDAIAKTKEKCKNCSPDAGSLQPESTNGWKAWTIEYQQRIGQMPPAPPGFINEWVYMGVRFDGFDSSQCLLKEAKARYDQFFDEWGRPYAWWASNVDERARQIRTQDAVARPAPPVRLEWFWQQPISYRYFSTVLQEVAPRVLHHYEP